MRDYPFCHGLFVNATCLNNKKHGIILRSIGRCGACRRAPGGFTRKESENMRATRGLSVLLAVLLAVTVCLQPVAAITAEEVSTVIAAGETRTAIIDEGEEMAYFLLTPEVRGA